LGNEILIRICAQKCIGQSEFSDNQQQAGKKKFTQGNKMNFYLQDLHLCPTWVKFNVRDLNTNAVEHLQVFVKIGVGVLFFWE
jgi:hypothetical protein